MLVICLRIVMSLSHIDKQNVELIEIYTDDTNMISHNQFIRLIAISVEK